MYRNRHKLRFSEQVELNYRFISWLTFAGPDVTEAMLQISSQDVFTPRAVGPGAEEGSNSLLLTHSAGPRTGAPLPPVCPRTVSPLTVGPYTDLVSIWEHITNDIKLFDIVVEYLCSSN